MIRRKLAARKTTVLFQSRSRRESGFSVAQTRRIRIWASSLKVKCIILIFLYFCKAEAASSAVDPVMKESLLNLLSASETNGDSLKLRQVHTPIAS